LEFGSFRREDRPGISGPVFCLKATIQHRFSVFDWRKIGRAEQPHVHEHRVESLERRAEFVKARLKGQERLVGIEEGPSERPDIVAKASSIDEPGNPVAMYQPQSTLYPASPKLTGIDATAITRAPSAASRRSSMS
jgi:hypothetical protein